MGVQLATGAVTALLAEDVVRRRLMAMLEDAPGSARVAAPSDEPAVLRLERVRATVGARVLIVDRLTDGLAGAERRTVLSRLRAHALETGAAVLVDDTDSVAALAVADHVLRVDPVRGLVVEPADGGLYRAS